MFTHIDKNGKLFICRLYSPILLQPIKLAEKTHQKQIPRT